MFFLKYFIRFPLYICREKYQTMDPAMKAIFSDKLEYFAEDYGLEDHTFDSYARQYGTTLTMSASDMVYSLTSLLDAPIDLQREKEKTQLGHIISGGGDSSTDMSSSDDVWSSNFYFAFDALEP